MGPFYRRTVQYSTVQYGTLPYLHRTVRAYWVGDIFCGVKRTQSHKATKPQTNKHNSQSLPDYYNKILVYTVGQYGTVPYSSILCRTQASSEASLGYGTPGDFAGELMFFKGYDKNI